MTALSSALGATVKGSRVFLIGPAGSGKTTQLQERLVQLLQTGQPAYSILIIIAETEHANRFVDFVKDSSVGPYSDLNPTTFNHLSRKMVNLFWPLIARDADFSSPHHPPNFLSYDLAQLLMGQVIDPMIDQGAFSGLLLRRQGIISQVLDTLNRAALNRLSIEEASERQIQSWAGSAVHRQALSDAAEAARKFRRRCLENNVLDLSLTVSVFERQLLGHPEFQRYFSERYRHILVDNLEEQTPAGQHFIQSLLEDSDSALLVFDQGGGYKRFLAADPQGAFQLKEKCDHLEKTEASPDDSLSHLANLVENRLLFTSLPVESASFAIREVITSQLRAQMTSGVVDQLAQLLADGIEPEEIVIVAPYLDSGLIFSLGNQLTENNIPHRFIRRRAVPRNEPRVRAWLTWLALAHPSWELEISEYDIAEAMSLSLTTIDPVRAQLLARHIYTTSGPSAIDLNGLPNNISERLGAQTLELVDELFQWLKENGDGSYPVDIFLHRLFHELLGQPQYKPQPDLAGAAICDWLVRTAKRLRQAARPLGIDKPGELGIALYNAIYEGLVAARPPDLGELVSTAGVTVATVYSYLLIGKPTRYQFWLDVGATGWWDIPRQPLSNAFVLNPSWQADVQWTMAEDVKVRNQLLSRIIRGLTCRCTENVIVATSEIDRRGLRQEGPLWRALRSITTIGQIENNS